MDDLISRAAALNAIDCWHINFNSMDGAKVQTDCWKTIKELPAVDAVPVVRCKNCKYWETDWKPNNVQDGVHFCPMVSLVRRGDWFCANGERRSETK